MPERIRPEGEAPKLVPGDAVPIGFYGGFKFFYRFVSDAEFGARAIGFVYVKSRESDEIEFVQATAVRHDLVADHSKKEVKRGLALDAIQRAKHRIAQDAFKVGELYAIELDEPSVRSMM